MRIKLFSCYIKKILLFIIICSQLLILGNCKKEKLEYLDNPLALVYKDNIPYIINNKNETHSLARYDEVLHQFDDYLIVKLDNKYGYIKNTGEEIIAPQYDEAFLMRENKAVVRIDHTYYIIDNLGNVLYTFPNGLSSTSYFSESYLVVDKEHNGKPVQTYLSYNDETKEFSLFTNTFVSCKNFKDGFSVVGFSNNDEIKYCFIKKDGTLLATDTYYDEAFSFNDGYARVANYEKIIIDSYQVNILNYSFIDTNGKYLSINDNQVKYHYALDFNDGLALVANYSYYREQKMYYKLYQVIDKTGINLMEDAIYYAIGSVGTPSTFWPGSFNLLTDETTSTHVFRAREGGAYGSWSVKYYAYAKGTTRYLFYDAKWIFTEDDEAGWLTEITKILSKKASNNFLAKSYAKSPYEMDEIRYSDYFDPNIPITKVRIYGQNKYGIIQIAYNQTLLQYEITYLIPPLYDMIFY